MAQWRSAAPLLQAIRDRELRELTPADALRASELVLETSPPPGQPRPADWSGLVDQQAWFMRLRLLNAEHRKT